VTRGTIEVGVYEPPTPLDSTHSARASGTPWIRRTGFVLGSRSVSRRGVMCSGVLASLLLHAFLITSLAWGGLHPRVDPLKAPELGAAASRAGSNSELSLELVSIEEPVSRRADDDPELESPALVAVTLEAATADARVPSILDPEDSRTDPSEADAPGRSALIGRYLGQINARIERAWSRPRTPIDDGLFSCRVRIEQDAHGAVNEIVLEHCNGDARWQVSLVHAIELASPLPAPPDPSVFRRVLRMDFRAEPYTAQAQQDAYEPIPQQH